jgi:flagellar biogenesis protein FliO
VKRLLCILFGALVICVAPSAYRHAVRGDWRAFSSGRSGEKLATSESEVGEGVHQKFGEIDSADGASSGGPMRSLEATATKICVVAAVLLLLIGLINGMRRRSAVLGGFGGKNAIQIISKLSLGQRHHLVVVAYEQNKFLISIGPNGVGPVGPLDGAAKKVFQENASPEGKMP